MPLTGPSRADGSRSRKKCEFNLILSLFPSFFSFFLSFYSLCPSHIFLFIKCSFFHSLSASPSTTTPSSYLYERRFRRIRRLDFIFTSCFVLFCFVFFPFFSFAPTPTSPTPTETTKGKLQARDGKYFRAHSGTHGHLAEVAAKNPPMARFISLGQWAWILLQV